MHRRPGCLVACGRTEHSIEKGLQTHQMQQDVAPDYRTHRAHWMQSPDNQRQDATSLYQTQDDLLLMRALDTQRNRSNKLHRNG